MTSHVVSDIDRIVHELSHDDAQEAKCGRRIKDGETWWGTTDPVTCPACRTEEE